MCFQKHKAHKRSVKPVLQPPCLCDPGGDRVLEETANGPTRAPSGFSLVSASSRLVTEWGRHGPWEQGVAGVGGLGDPLVPVMVRLWARCFPP